MKLHYNGLLANRRQIRLLMVSMSSSARKQFWFFFRLLVSIALLAWLVLGFNWRETWQAMLKISIGGIVILLLGLLLNRLLAFYRFWVLLRSEGVELSLGTVMRVSFLATFAGNFLPTTVGGDLAKIGWFASKGYSTWRVALWTLFDRLSNMLAVCLLAPFCLLLPFIRTYSTRWLGGWATDFLPVFMLFLLLNLAVGIVLGLLPGRNPEYGCLASPEAVEPVQESGMLPKARALWKKVLSRRRTFGLLALISYLSIVPNLLATWLAAQNLGLQVSLWGVTAIYVVLYFVTLLPVSLNGLGIQEIGTVALYTSLGASPSQAAALAILLRFAIWITTLPGAFAFDKTGLAAGPVHGKISESE